MKHERIHQTGWLGLALAGLFMAAAPLSAFAMGRQNDVERDSPANPNAANTAPNFNTATPANPAPPYVAAVAQPPLPDVNTTPTPQKWTVENGTIRPTGPASQDSAAAALSPMPDYVPNNLVP